MEKLSADMSDFQDTLIDLFFDEGPKNLYSPTDLEVMRGKFLNDAESITDHGSMMKYDSTKDWTRTATPMVQWSPSSREVKMAVVVISAEKIHDTGVTGFLASMKFKLELKLGFREAADVKCIKTVGKGMTH